MTPNLADVLSARRAIASGVARTPLVPSAHLSEAAGAEVLLKLESLQPTGAFKLRGALNAIAHLPAGTPGVTCCSTGNHGRAIAWAARARGLRAVVCMSELVPATKVEAIRALGAEVRITGRSQDEAAAVSCRLAETDGLAEIPPFDDPRVIAGQGTAGLELVEDRPNLATVLVPLSGFVTDVLVPGVQSQIDGIRDLTPPEGDEDTVDSILDAAQKANDEVADDPSSIAGNNDPFADANQQAKAYGFKECGQ